MRSEGAASTKPNYSVKNIEPVVIGTDVQVRIFTVLLTKLDPNEQEGRSWPHFQIIWFDLMRDVR